MTNKTWKGKGSDFPIAMLYFIGFVLFVHVASSLNIGRRHRYHYSAHEENVMDNLLSFPHFLLILAVMSIFISPVWIYFRKAPKSLTIDVPSNKLLIQKRTRKKSFNFNLDAISYFQHTFPFYSILEIYAEFEGSRGQIINKRVYTLVVPNWGLSWNKKVIDDIEKSLREVQVPVNRSFKLKNFWEYLYD